MISEPTPEMVQLIVHDAEMTRDRDQWRRALNDCTPGGSEFTGDPEYCKKYVRDRWEALWNSNKKFVLENRKFREALEDVLKALRLVRNGAEGKEIQTLARDLVVKLEELNVGKGKQPPSPGPDEPLAAIARQERV